MLRHRAFMLLRRLGSLPATLYEEREGGDDLAAGGEPAIKSQCPALLLLRLRIRVPLLHDRSCIAASALQCNIWAACQTRCIRSVKVAMLWLLAVSRHVSACFALLGLWHAQK